MEKNIDENLDTIGQRIKYQRQLKKMSQEVLEAKTGIQRSLLSKYERSTDIPRMPNLNKIAKALGADINFFLSSSINNISLKEDDYKDNLFSTSEFAARLQALRYSKKLSQVDLSKISTIYHGQIAKYERCFSKPSLYNSILLADALGVTIDYLLRGSNSNTSKTELLDSKLSKILVEINELEETNKLLFINFLEKSLNGFKK